MRLACQTFLRSFDSRTKLVVYSVLQSICIRHFPKKCSGSFPLRHGEISVNDRMATTDTRLQNGDSPASVQALTDAAQHSSGNGTDQSAGPVNSPGKPGVQARRRFRSSLIRQVTLWHWVSSGICLGGMLLFTITGITLNHASTISAQPVVTTRELPAPPEVRDAIRDPQLDDGRHPLPSVAASWIAREFGSAGDGVGEWSVDELYVSLPRPGGDAWVSVDRASGAAFFEATDRGWISYFNDLHKGRHTGKSWSIYIDVLAVACLVFSLSGLILLQVHAAKRPSTWPLIVISVLTPLLVLLFFVHT